MQLTSREGCFFLMVLCRYEDMRRKGGNMTNVFRGVKHVYCARFMLTVFHNGNPSINNCCGATEGSEQQHNQDLKEIYKGRRILDFITFYHNALHLTTLFTTMHCI